jgi:hypothetical protein
VWVLLTKIDLLSETEQGEVLAFLEKTLQDKFSSAIPVLPFSTRSDVQRWTQQLEENVLRPVAGNVSQEREKALAWKLGSIALACRGYVEIGLRVAERADTERERLRAAVLNETVNSETIHDELRQAERGIRDRTRPAFERFFASQRASLASQMGAALATELPTWNGSLAQQTGRYESWIKERLVAELTPRSAAAAAEENRLITQAEERFRRIAEAFRDRLGRNIREEMGVAVSAVAWEAVRPQLARIDINTSRTFMFDWELLSWVLPMSLVGGLFQRHVLRRLSWEVEKNLTRLVGQWTDAATAAVTDLRTQAAVWVDAELATLDRLLGQKPIESSLFREALETLNLVGGPELT